MSVNAEIASEAELREMFEWFAGVRERESPLYARLSRLLAKNPQSLEPLGPLPNNKHLPVLLFGSIHYLALGGDPLPLAEIFRNPAAAPRDTDLGVALASFLRENGSEVAQLVATRRTPRAEVTGVPRPAAAYRGVRANAEQASISTGLDQYDRRS